MLAKSVNDNADILDGRSILEFFASKLAPTVVFGVSHTAFSKLWKTNPASSQSATYSRRKSLFCHSFDLSPCAVEPAVGNVVVLGCTPLKP